MAVGQGNGLEVEEFTGHNPTVLDFNYDDNALVFIDTEGHVHRIRPDISNEEFLGLFVILVADEEPPIAWEEALQPELRQAEANRYAYSNFARFRDFYLFSDPTYNNGFGRIVVLAQDKHVAVIVGDTDTLRIGEYMWIGGEHAANEFDEYGSVVIATSTRTSHSLVTPYRITIIKLIEVNEGEYRVFKYGTDVLSLRASTGAESPVESVKFKDGNFFYIDANPIDGTRKVKQMRTCTNLQYYDTRSHECLPCPPGYATTSFQQTSCVRCDDLWYGADPSSLEYYMAMELCADPEADYYLNNPAQTESEATPTAGVVIDTQNFSTKISVWWIIIGVVILLLVIAIILVLILWRAYKMQQKSNKRERNQGNEEKEPRAETFELVPTHPRSSFVADSRR